MDEQIEWELIRGAVDGAAEINLIIATSPHWRRRWRGTTPEGMLIELTSGQLEFLTKNYEDEPTPLYLRGFAKGFCYVISNH